MGHQIEPSDTIGSAQMVMLEESLILDATDPRRPGSAVVGVPNLAVERLEPERR